MEVIEISMREYSVGMLARKELYEMACMPGAHTFAATEDTSILGVAIVSADPLGRGYTIHHISKIGKGDDSVYAELLDVIEEFCEDNDATELRCSLYFQESMSEVLLDTLEKRGFLDAHTEKTCFVYKLNDIERVATYDNASKEQMDLLEKSLKSYKKLSDAEMRSLEQVASMGSIYEDMDLSLDTYASCLFVKDELYGYVDVRELDSEIFIVHDDYLRGDMINEMMLVLLTRSIEEIKKANYKNPTFIIPVNVEGLDKQIIKAFGEPSDKYAMHSSVKLLGEAAADSKDEDTRYKLVFVRDEEVYQKFSPFFPEGASYLSGEYIVIGAIDTIDKKPVGVMALSSTETEIGIEYIYVDENYRGELIGAWFIDTAKDFAFSEGMPKELACSFDINNEALFRFFFERPDMDLSKEGETYLIAPTDVEESVFLQNMLKKPSTKNTCVADIKENKSALMHIISEQIKDSKQNDFSRMNKELSQAYVVDGMLKALLIFEDLDEDTVELSYLMRENSSTQVELYVVIRNAIEAYKKLCPEKNIKASVVKGALDIKTVFPNAKSVGGICVARWNYAN